MKTSYFHVSPETFLPGDVKQKGRYGALLESDENYVLDDPHGEFFRESVRQKYYPGKPSRLRSSFVFETIEDARNFRDGRGGAEKIYAVLFASEPPAVHRVCYAAWSMSHPNLIAQAHEYWRNPLCYSSVTELFAEADLVILGEA